MIERKDEGKELVNMYNKKERYRETGGGGGKERRGDEKGIQMKMYQIEKKEWKVAYSTKKVMARERNFGILDHLSKALLMAEMQDLIRLVILREVTEAETSGI